MRTSWAIMVAVLLGGTLGRASAATDDPAEAVRTKLLAEAEKMRKDQPAAWKDFDQAVDKALKDHAEKYKNWMRRAPPPQPSVVGLKLPLSYLVWRYEQAVLKGDKSELWGGHLFGAAIAESADARRVEYFLDAIRWHAEHVKGKPYAEHLAADWLLVRSVPPERADAVFRILLAEKVPLSHSQRTYLLIDRFADRLSAENRKRAYEYIRQGWDQGPTNGEGNRYWTTLFKLDPRRAGREVIAYFGGKDPSRTLVEHHALQLLAERGVECPEAAAFLTKRVAQNRERGYADSQLRIALLRADLEKQRAPFVRHLEALLTKVVRPPRTDDEAELRTEVDSEAEALFKLVPDKALPDLRRFVNEPKIEELPRLRLLGRLAKVRDPKVKELAAAWLSGEPEDYAREWLRKAMRDEWGAYGRQMLREIGQ